MWLSSEVSEYFQLRLGTEMAIAWLFSAMYYDRMLTAPTPVGLTQTR
jgi:hypothetical protein